MNKLIRHATLAFSLALLAPAALDAQHFASNEDFEVMLHYLVEDGEAPGIVLGVLEADGSTRIIAAGNATPDMLFEIGSITKTFTGALLADMVAKGEVALDDPVSKYLPDGVTMPTGGSREITLLDLATHRSGLPRLPDNFTPPDMTNPYAAFTVDKLYDFLRNHKMRRDPGAEDEYSNVGVGLLGHALARAAGTTWADLVRERIFEPLGMTSTRIELDSATRARMSPGHDENGQVVPFWTATEAIQGAGMIRSNMHDMLKYLDANVGPPATDLERAMRDAHEIRNTVAGGEAHIGLLWQVQRYDGRSLIQHGGGTGGFRTSMGFDPDKQVGFVLLTNSAGFSDDIGQDFVRRGPPLAIPEVAVSRQTLSRYAGEYELAPGGSAFVKLEDDGTLTVKAGQNVRFRMYAKSDTSFFLKRTPWKFTFTTNDAGDVAGVVADLEGNVRNGKRVSDRTAPPAVLDLVLTAEDIARYEGTYILEAGQNTRELRVFGEDGRLMGQSTGQAARLRAQGDHVFVPTFNDAVRLVFTVVNGRAESVALHQGGNVTTGKRTP